MRCHDVNVDGFHVNVVHVSWFSLSWVSSSWFSFPWFHAHVHGFGVHGSHVRGFDVHGFYFHPDPRFRAFMSATLRQCRKHYNSINVYTRLTFMRFHNGNDRQSCALMSST